MDLKISTHIIQSNPSIYDDSEYLEKIKSEVNNYVKLTRLVYYFLELIYAFLKIIRTYICFIESFLIYVCVLESF